MTNDRFMTIVWPDSLKLSYSQIAGGKLWKVCRDRSWKHFRELPYGYVQEYSTFLFTQLFKNESIQNWSINNFMLVDKDAEIMLHLNYQSVNYVVIY